MKNLEKYLTLLDGEVDGLLLTSRYSRHYGAEFDIAEGVAIVTKAGCRYFTDSRYIESAQAGLKGFSVGGAAISTKHAGFAVNLGGATAADVRELLQQVSDKVYDRTGIRLEPEVRIW